MDRNQLWRLIQQKEKEFERNKGKRAIYTILLYAGILLLIAYMLSDGFSGFSFLTFLATVAACVFWGGAIFAFNATIIGQLYSKSRAESEILEDLRKQLQEVEKNDIY